MAEQVTTLVFVSSREGIDMADISLALTSSRFACSIVQYNVWPEFPAVVSTG
jgi:hypothetical protein